MIALDPVDRVLAAKLMDFAGGGVARSIADAQLDGAVAIHNILARHRVAYLADEVGMGKTYVALGVVALLRTLHPGARVLYIAPRSNIQRKWCDRELPNFVARAWRMPDQRVRAIDNQPAAPFVSCERLLDWARAAVRNPDRDVFLRMTSFSVALTDDTQQWVALREQLRSVVPGVSLAEVDARNPNKERFKEAYGRALNRVIPHYDLVVVDEAHNLKHGPRGGSTRNRLLAAVLGGLLGSPLVEGEAPRRRFDRVLLLSATPLETEFSELANQLQLFGFEKLAQPLLSKDPEQAKNHAKEFVVRRLATVRLADRQVGKHDYRREWRGGGVSAHDAPLEVPDLRQKLIVGLMQKKVTEVVKRSFGAQFQIGMLASFESFAESTSTFDDPEQTDDESEREGIDSHVVTRIARSYRRAFKKPVPHPKMESVVAELAEAMRRGEKSLVFVRRLRSVDELGERLCRSYDEWLRGTARAKLPEPLRTDWDAIWTRYEAEREAYFEKRRLFATAAAAPKQTEGDDEPNPRGDARKLDADTGGFDTFFSWFFRGEGQPDILSGASFRKNRIENPSAALNLLFEDNYVSGLLGDAPDVLEALAAHVASTPDGITSELMALASAALMRSGAKPERSHYFWAYQEAALWLMKEHGAQAAEASIVLEEWFPLAKGARDGRTPKMPGPGEYLSEKTFFTELRRRAELCDTLWPDDSPADARFPERFRRREFRRVLLSSMIRLGHPMVDLWALGVRGARTLRGERGEVRGRSESLEDFALAYLDLLEGQLHEPGHTGARELARAAETFDLLVQANFAEAQNAPLRVLPRRIAQVLRRQTPVAGMTGTHRSDTGVQQFRMPGYPFVIVATDVLQEGEDLHTFCSRVIHYGLAWTPSSTEQRTGRVDRIGSLIHRSLENLSRLPAPEERLQIYYPYLADTVERLQAERVFDRLNRFFERTHEGLGGEGAAARPTVDTDDAYARPTEIQAPVASSFETAFPVRPADLVGRTEYEYRAAEETTRVLELFRQHLDQVASRIMIEWAGTGHDSRRLGTVFLRNRDLVAPGDAFDRRQPIGLYLRADGRGSGTNLHVISPIGIGQSDVYRSRMAGIQDECLDAKVTESDFDDRGTCLYATEVHVRFHPDDVAVEETLDAIRRAAMVADAAEQLVFECDRPLDDFKARLERFAKR